MGVNTKFPKFSKKIFVLDGIVDVIESQDGMNAIMKNAIHTIQRRKKRYKKQPDLISDCSSILLDISDVLKYCMCLIKGGSL